MEGTKGFDDPAAAVAYYDGLGPKAHLYMLQINEALALAHPPQPPIAGGLPHEIDPNTLPGFEGVPLEPGGASFNFASRLKLRQGTTWEWMPQAEADPEKLIVKRGDPSQPTRRNYYFVSPNRNMHFKDESR